MVFARLSLTLAALVAGDSFGADLPPLFNVGAQVDDVSTGTVAEDTYAPWRLTPKRAGHVNLRDNAGNEVGISGAPLRIDPTGTTSQPVKLQDGAGNALASSTSAPAGAEQALIVRNVPSGTQTVSGTVTANVGTTGGLALDATVSSGNSILTSISGKLNDNYGSASGALRSAAQIGNASGAADFGAGTTSAQTVRAVLPTDQSDIPVRTKDGSGNSLTSTSGALNVNVTNSFAAGSADKTTFTYGTSIENSVGGVYQDTSPTLTAGQQGAVRMTQYRAFHTNLRDASGNELASSTSAPAGTEQALVVRPIVSGTQTVSGTVTANVGTTGGLALDATVSTGNTTLSTINGKLNDNYGAASGALRVASQVGNASGVADFGAGATSAQTQRVVLPTDQSAIPVTTATPWSSNVAQFGGTNVSTGTGASGAGIPRVTVSSDSSITNISGTVSLPTGASTETTLAKLTQTQASTTSGQSGPLVQGAVTTAPPTYTTAQTNPLSLTTAGGLRTDTSSVAGTTTATGNGVVGAGVQRVAIASDNSSVTVNHLDTAPANGSITAFDAGTSTFAGANGQAFYAGTPTANSSTSFSLSSIGCADVQATVIGAGGTMVVETSMDGGTFWVRPAIFQPGTTNNVNSFNLPFILHLNTAGVTNLRVRALTSWSGTATISVKESINPCSVTIADPLTVMQGTTPWADNISQFGGSAVATGTGTSGAGIPRVTVASDSSLTSNQGTPAATANAWPVKTTDGTNVAAVKAASTAALATDPAAVVTLSPNGNQATATNQATEIAALQLVDNLPHANNVALNNGVPIMGQLDDTSTGTVTEDNVSTVRITGARGIHTNLRNAAGTEVGTTSSPLITADVSITKASYSSSVSNIGVSALPTDVFTITGSATKTVRIKQVRLSGTETTGAVRDFDLVKRSTANSGGTSTSVTAVPHDSSNSAATATVKSYTVNPTLGTLIGVLRSDAWSIPAASLSGQTGVLIWDMGLNFQEIVLRGTSEVLAINCEGVTMAGNAMNFTVVWEEE